LKRRLRAGIVSRCFRGDRDPDLGVSAAFGLAGLAAQPAGVFEHREGAVDLAAFLVAAILFPDALCGRWSRRPALTGANGLVVAFSGT
jgi:hypothetical protein